MIFIFLVIFHAKGIFSGFLSCISQLFTVFWKFWSCIDLFFHEILYCIPVLLKKIAVGGLSFQLPTYIIKVGDAEKSTQSKFN